MKTSQTSETNAYMGEALPCGLEDLFREVSLPAPEGFKLVFCSNVLSPKILASHLTGGRVPGSGTPF